MLTLPRGRKKNEKRRGRKRKKKQTVDPIYTWSTASSRKMTATAHPTPEMRLANGKRGRHRWGSLHGNNWRGKQVA